MPEIQCFFFDDPAFSPPSGYASRIVTLYREPGWWDGPDSPEHVLRIIQGSHCFAVAVKDGAIVGMGRAVSDRVSDAYIQDLTVDKEFRGRGIGTRIVEFIVERLRNDGLQWIGLIAEKGSAAFYEAVGFEKMKNATPMILKRK